MTLPESSLLSLTTLLMQLSQKYNVGQVRCAITFEEDEFVINVPIQQNGKNKFLPFRLEENDFQKSTLEIFDQIVEHIDNLQE